MTEIDRILDQLQKAFDGKAWHGPSVLELLADVGADRAAARPITEAHTIWELVHHIAAWEDMVRRCLEGEEMRSLPAEEDWPPVLDTSEEAWRKSVEELETVHRRLLEALSLFGVGRLEETVPGASYSFYAMLHGLVQHDLYHAGQIAILKK